MRAISRIFVAMVTVAAGVAIGYEAHADTTTAGRAARAVFVAPTGNDANAGTPAEQPVRTLGKARDLARAAGAGTTVVLAGGTYQLSQPITLTAADSGITWSAAPGARPVISGGRPVTGWKKSGNLWSAPVPAGLKTRQLYVNGVRAQRASGPLPVKATTNDT